MWFIYCFLHLYRYIFDTIVQAPLYLLQATWIKSVRTETRQSWDDADSNTIA